MNFKIKWISSKKFECFELKISFHVFFHFVFKNHNFHFENTVNLDNIFLLSPFFYLLLFFLIFINRDSRLHSCFVLKFYVFLFISFFFASIFLRFLCIAEIRLAIPKLKNYLLHIWSFFSVQ